MLLAFCVQLLQIKKKKRTGYTHIVLNEEATNRSNTARIVKDRVADSFTMPNVITLMSDLVHTLLKCPSTIHFHSKHVRIQASSFFYLWTKHLRLQWVIKVLQPQQGPLCGGA